MLNCIKHEDQPPSTHSKCGKYQSESNSNMTSLLCWDQFCTQVTPQSAVINTNTGFRDPGSLGLDTQLWILFLANVCYILPGQIGLNVNMVTQSWEQCKNQFTSRFCGCFKWFTDQINKTLLYLSARFIQWCIMYNKTSSQIWASW